jgi:hypothetical protein
MPLERLRGHRHTFCINAKFGQIDLFTSSCHLVVCHLVVWLGPVVVCEAMATRFHPWNCNKECVGCNRQDYSRYGKEKSFEYGLAVDEKWGLGTAIFLYRLAETIEPWTTIELEQLRSAARMGPRAYGQLYREIRPHHFPNL